MIERAFSDLEQDGPETLGQRLAAAIAAHPRAPEGKHGRLTWLQKEMEMQTGLHVSIETIRKWLADDISPRSAKVHALAKTLHVDPGWLSLGSKPVTSTREQEKMVRSASGATLLVAGIMGMEGYTCAFPREDDKTARLENVHLYVIVEGTQFKVTVAHGEPQNEHMAFSVEGGPPRNAVIGAVNGPKPLTAVLLDLTGQTFKPHGGYSTLILDKPTMKKLEMRKVTSLLK